VLRRTALAGYATAALLVAAAPPVSAEATVTVQAAAVSSGGTVQDAIVQGFNGDEWFIVKTASGYALDEAAAGGSLTSSSIRSLPATGISDPNGIVAMVSAKGYVWALGSQASDLWAINKSGSTANAAAESGIDTRDMTLGPDGNLWATDTTGDIIKYAITNSGTATMTEYSINAVAPDAITSAGGYLVWSDALGHLWYTKPSSPGSPVGPDAATRVSDYAHSMVEADGDLWAAGSIGVGQQGEIEKLSATPPYAFRHAFSGASSSEVTSITKGPDGDLWFPEAGANKIGQLDPATGAIIQHPLPTGFALPQGINPFTPYAIAPGPRDTVWFTAKTSGGQPAVGEVSGIITSPAEGTVSVAKTAVVSSKGVVSLSVKCGGEPGATCAGTLTLTSQNTRLGSCRFHATATESLTLSVKLSKAGVKAINKAKHHKLEAIATETPTGARSHRSSIALVGPKQPVK
jgi:streptogramin lyase